MNEAVVPVAATRRLRVAVLNRQFKPTGGGAERYSIAMVEALAQRHEIHVFAQDIEHHWPGVTYHRVPCFFRRPRWINQLWFAMATWSMTRRGYDLVHSHENTWHGMVQTVHVVPLKYGLFHGKLGLRRTLQWLQVITSPRLLVYLALERARYARPRQIVVASQAVHDIMLEWHPRTNGRLTVITPGIHAVSPARDALEKTSARRQLGLPEHGRCVLFVGNDFLKKGLPTLLQAMQHLPPEDFLAVVGPKAQKAFVEKDATYLLVKERVHFIGSLPDVAPAYRAADCLAHPTLEDTFAMVVLEAMASGVPVVVSQKRYCGISALIQDGTQALLISDPRDSTQVAQSLMRVLTDDGLRLQLQGNAREFAGAFLWSRLARQQEALYYAVT